MKEKEMKFEDAMKRLEKIVQELEDGNLGLEESLKKYQEGIGLSQFCTKKLNEAQKTVQVLSKKGSGPAGAGPHSGAGKLQATPFDEKET